jgi:hypothetical protein
MPSAFLVTLFSLPVESAVTVAASAALSLSTDATALIARRERAAQKCQGPISQ